MPDVVHPDDLWEARVKLPLPSETKAKRLSCISWLRLGHSRELHKFIYEREYVDYLCIGWKLVEIKPK